MNAAQPTSVDNHSQAAMRIALAAGEPSGDLLGADLIQSLRILYPNAAFAGITGPAMRDAGCDSWFDCRELAVMGVFEVLRHLPRLLVLRHRFQQRLLAWKPDVFIGIDAPDFNLRIGRWLKRRHIRTVHYVSPAIWAWKAQRARHMHGCTDLVLCLFPMEPPLYQSHHVAAQFVGHPMADAIPLVSDRTAARKALQLPPQRVVLAVLPGSRLGEIARLGAIFLAAAAIVMQRSRATIHIVIPAANSTCLERIRQQILASAIPASQITVVAGHARHCMTAADVVLLASGTATLEAMLIKRPMVVGYKLNPLTYGIARLLKWVTIQHYALPNILAPMPIVPERIQHACTPDALADAVIEWLDTPAAVQRLQPICDAVHRQLRCHASERAANAIKDLLTMAPSL